jgi:hypothetical protein
VSDSASDRLVTVAEYELVSSASAYEQAIKALAARTEREGLEGVVTYRFYVGAEGTDAGAVITYADSATWLQHHQMVAAWEEYPGLQATVRLTAYRVFGPASPEVRAGLEAADLPVRLYPRLAAGFDR